METFRGKLECIATSLADARAIEAAGGGRIELVSALREGGFTPSDGLVRSVLEEIRIPVSVMLRPNKAGFCYSEAELEEMRRDAQRFHELGVQRVVTGILDPEGLADIETLEALLEGTDLQVTFHRAIDETSDIEESLRRINACPRITHLLTSLGPGKLPDNLFRLAWYAEHTRPRLILGSGLDLDNLGNIAEKTHFFDIDLHMGTGLRHGRALQPLDPVLLEKANRILGKAQEEIHPSPASLIRNFRSLGYGLFIHFGLYSLPGGRYKGETTPFLAEWIRLTMDIPHEEYRSLAALFHPTAFDADRICRQAAAWGMHYLCFTAKHHDGFALFDSKADPFNSVRQSPGGRDYVRELSEACKKYGLAFCLYYSQAQDWDHPGGLRAYREASPKEDFKDYFENKCLPQIEELLTSYGPVTMLWLDTPMSMGKEESRRIRGKIKSLQPGCLVSGRIGHGLGDYITAGDNRLPCLAQRRFWEVPASLNGSFGYKEDDRDWKSPKELIHLLTKTRSRGGNLLINIGPDGQGRIPYPSENILDEAGDFLRIYGPAFHGDLKYLEYPYEQDLFILTAKDRDLFIHLLDWPPRGRLELYQLEGRPQEARLMKKERPLDLLVSRDLEGYSYWRINLTEFEKEIKAELERFGETVIQLPLSQRPGVQSF